MPTRDEAVDAILEELLAIARNDRIPSSPKALMLLRLAEAYAWLAQPGQPHGGRLDSDL